MIKLKAELLPLGGKYYGSEIELKVEGDPSKDALIQVWVNRISNYEPSERELEGWDEEEYGPYEISDDHFESEAALKVCHAIVEALDGLEV